MKVVDRIAACQNEIRAVYAKKLEYEDQRFGRTAEEAKSLQYSILAALRNNADMGSIKRVYGVSEFYAVAVREVHGR